MFNADTYSYTSTPADFLDDDLDDPSPYLTIEEIIYLKKVASKDKKLAAILNHVCDGLEVVLEF